MGSQNEDDGKPPVSEAGGRARPACVRHSRIRCPVARSASRRADTAPPAAASSRAPRSYAASKAAPCSSAAASAAAPANSLHDADGRVCLKVKMQRRSQAAAVHQVVGSLVMKSGC